MSQQEFVVIDPVLGEVSCDSRADAVAYVDKHGGEAYVVNWQDGKEIGRYIIYPFTF